MLFPGKFYNLGTRFSALMRFIYRKKVMTLKKVLQRTEQEIEEAYARNVDAVYRVCFSFMKNPADTEDMVQDTLSVPRKRESRAKPWKQTAVILAAAVALLLLSVSAYALGWFGLEDLFMRQETVHYIGDMSDTTFVTIYSGGFSDTPEYRAAAEWQAFLDGYDPDGSLLRQIGNSAVDLDEHYTFYNCYTPEMAEALDSIAAKYGLRLLSDLKIFKTFDELYSYAGTGSIIRPDTESEEAGYAYSDGTLFFESTITPKNADGGWVYPTDYQFIRQRKGTLTTGILNIREWREYDQWEYDSASGVPLLLALGPGKALIVADLETSFVMVNVLDTNAGDVLLGEAQMSPTDLEAIADCFDFSVIP